MNLKGSLALGAAAVFMSAFPAIAQEAETDSSTSVPAAGSATTRVVTDEAGLGGSEAALTDPAETGVEGTISSDNQADADTVGDEVEPGPVTMADATDILQGVEVRGPEGELVGTIESVDSEGAVVSTGEIRAKLPFQSFGKNGLGLVISLNRSELEAAAAAADPT